MAQANLDVIREMLDAVTQRNPDRFVACLTPDVEWDDREGWPGIRRVYHGPAGVRRWMEAFMKTARLTHVEIEELEEATRDRVLLGVLGTFQGEFSGKSTKFDARAWYVFWLRKGKVRRAQLFWARDQAFQAAGMSG